MRKRQLAVNVGVATVDGAILLACIHLEVDVLGKVQNLVHSVIIGHFYLVELLIKDILIFCAIGCKELQ
jgi:hypothetical protein